MVAFEKLLRSVSRAAACHRLGVLRKSWRVFHDRSLRWRCFRGFVLHVFESVLQCGFQLPIRTLNYWTVLSVMPFYNWVSDWLWYCSSFIYASTLIHLHKNRRNPMHPLNCVLPGLYVPVRVTRGALIVHRYTYAPPRCRTSQYRKTFIQLSVSLWNDLITDSVFDGVGLAGFKSRPMLFYWLKLFYLFLSSIIFFFLFFLPIGWYCGAGVF